MKKPRFVALAVIMIAAFLSGCSAPTYRRLSSEVDIPALAPRIAATVATEKQTHLVPVTWRDQSIRLAVHTMGTGRRDRVLVMLHGGFADHETWRFIAGDLTRYYDLLLVDLPGCGASDHPVPHQSADDLFSPHATAEMILQAMENRLEHRRTYPKKIAMVGHSLGGTAALQMFHDEIRPRHRHLMSRVDHLVLLAPVDLALSEPNPTFDKITRAKGWQIHLANSLGLAREWGARAMERSMHDPAKAPREEVDRGIEILLDRGLRSGLQAQLEQAFRWEADGSPDWDYISHRLSAYDKVDASVLIVWGAQDQTLPVSMGHKMTAELPRARLRIIDDGKHSVHFEYPNRVLALIHSTIR